MNTFEKMLKDLREPFPKEQVHWRQGPGNKELAYIKAPDVMNRLDNVCGVNWQDRYPRDGYCEIGIYNGSEWIWRGNGAGETKIEGEKGKYSDAFKRAAVKWGVGRYLYYLGGKRELPLWAQPGYTPRFTKANEYAEELAQALVDSDDHKIIQLWYELDGIEELPYVTRKLNSAQRGTINEILEQHK